MDAGATLTNTATATGMPPTGTAVSDTDSEDVSVTRTPGISLVKEATPTTVSAEGDTVTYRFTVTNTGNVTLSDVRVEDTWFSGTGTLLDMSTCQPLAVSLPAGETVWCEATYSVTQADINAGVITNTATAFGTPPNMAEISAEDVAQVSATRTPALTLTKTANPTVITGEGDLVTYTFTVTNTGNVTIDNITVTELIFTGTGSTPSISCGPAPVSLDPGDSVDCTATYEATQADINMGAITNVAIASGTGPHGRVWSFIDTAIVRVTQTVAITLDKTASVSSVSDTELVTYTYTIRNTGNVTVDTIRIIEELSFTGLGTLPVISCPPVLSLTPGGELICTAEYRSPKMMLMLAHLL